MSELTLTDFLLARVADDYATAQADGADAMVGGRWKHLPREKYDRTQREALAAAKRLAAECEAKRRIIAWAEDDMGDDFERRKMLPLLAIPYTDHPDYREEWRP